MINEKRSNEIWATVNGENVCVSEKCMGAHMFSEISNNLRQGKTVWGGFRYTDVERADMKDFLLNEIGKTEATCNCGRVAF